MEVGGGSNRGSGGLDAPAAAARAERGGGLVVGPPAPVSAETVDRIAWTVNAVQWALTVFLGLTPLWIMLANRCRGGR